MAFTVTHFVKVFYDCPETGKLVSKQLYGSAGTYAHAKKVADSFNKQHDCTDAQVVALSCGKKWR